MRALGLLERLGQHLLGPAQAQGLAEALLPLLQAAIPAKCALPACAALQAVTMMSHAAEQCLACLAGPAVALSRNTVAGTTP